MDPITSLFKEHYAKTFAQHGATARGVDWADEAELLVRYDKMLAVLQKDFVRFDAPPSVLDVGCGWGGLWRRARDRGIAIRYTGIDVVHSMIDFAKEAFKDAEFAVADVFALEERQQFDFVVNNAILTQKLTATIPEMEQYGQRLIQKMFALCRHGIAVNMMSTRVNYMVNNLYYQNPAELLTWCLHELSPRVRLDHGYSSLASGKGKFYDFTAYVYRD